MILPRIILKEQPEIVLSREWVTGEEALKAASYATGRQREFFAWRMIVRRELGRDLRIGYNEAGAPQLENNPLYISVSHAWGYVAVVLSEKRCAIDIESSDRNFCRIADHYLSGEEQTLSQDERWLGVAWCAKECLVKYASREGLDLIGDLHLRSVDFKRGVVEARLDEKPLEVRFSFPEGTNLIQAVIL